MSRTKLIFILLPAMFVPWLASMLYFRTFDGHEAARYIYLAAKAFILGYPVLFIKMLSPDVRQAFRLDLKELAIGIAIGILMFTIGIYALRLQFIADMMSSASLNIKSKIESFGVLQYYIPFALIISFLHSMLEEYYWRWFVFGNLKKAVNNSVAHIFAAIAFSLHHYVVLKFYFPFAEAFVLTSVVALGGIMFSILYSRKNNIWGAWSAHVAADLIIMYAGWTVISG